MDEEHTPKTAINLVCYLMNLIFTLYVYFMYWNYYYSMYLFALFGFY